MYIKSVVWRGAKCLSYIEEARCLKVNIVQFMVVCMCCVGMWIDDTINNINGKWEE